ncbi:MAG TPA: GNAT family N-acetyltransferase [Phycisphaerae bacterium]|nr:GNAT family N-acetyltransferase [Phycisphaerae bacterium]
MKELEAEFEKLVIVKASINGKIVGSARGSLANDTASLANVAVHPYCQRGGIGQRLLRELETALPAKRLEIRIGNKSEQNIWLEKQGFRSTRSEVVSPALSWIYFQKECA